MDRFHIEIKMGNDAFGIGLDAQTEIARILRGIADKLDTGPEGGGKVSDINGNTVGGFWFD